MEVNVKHSGFKQISFNIFEIDMGEFNKGELVKADVEIRGTEVLSNRTTCRCTVSQVEKRDDVNYITVTVDTNATGSNKQQLIVYTSDNITLYFDVKFKIR